MSQQLIKMTILFHLHVEGVIPQIREVISEECCFRMRNRHLCSWIMDSTTKEKASPEIVIYSGNQPLMTNWPKVRRWINLRKLSNKISRKFMRAHLKEMGLWTLTSKIAKYKKLALKDFKLWIILLIKHFSQESRSTPLEVTQ